MDYHKIIHKMISTNKLHKKAIETAVDDIGIHRSRHQLLMKLSKQGTVNSQKEIAESLGISQAAVTGSLSSLERDGLIVRSVGNDCRFKNITVTEKGKEIVSVTKEHFSKVDEKTFEGLSEEDLSVFFKCLSVMEKNLTEITNKEEKNEKMV